MNLTFDSQDGKGLQTEKTMGQRFQLISCIVEKRLKHDHALFPLL